MRFSFHEETLEDGPSLRDGRGDEGVTGPFKGSKSEEDGERKGEDQFSYKTSVQNLYTFENRS